ncbi:MAG: GNAT family N-acetyltransferase [Paracoccaceae bacterium]
MVTIRLATLADLPAIRDCAEAAYGRYVPRIGRRPAPMDADFSGQIAAGFAHVAVDEKGEVRGYAIFWPQGDNLYLDSIAVRVRGQGLGAALMARAEGVARATGLRSIRLYTNAKMTENLTLYPHLGFVQTDRRMDEGFDRVFFEKTL